jgi:hypothetical protein
MLDGLKILADPAPPPPPPVLLFIRPLVDPSLPCPGIPDPELAV